MAEAIRYALNYWDGLRRFLEDERVKLANNSDERHASGLGLHRQAF